FEIKRRGELKLIKVFQAELFDKFVHGSTLEECYSVVASVANHWLDLIDDIIDSELLDYISESSTMSKSLADYDEQKSCAEITTTRLTDFLGVTMVKDKGLRCQYGNPLSEWAVPVAIFETDAVLDHSHEPCVPMDSLFCCCFELCIMYKIDEDRAGSESHPHMLNKENYVPWSSHLLQDTNRKVSVNETFHVHTDDELTEKELKQIEADNQAIQTILLGHPEDIYAAVDSCETTQEIWLRVQQMMKGSDIGIQEKKANQNGVALNQDQPSFNQNYMQQPMPNPEDIIDPTTAMNMELALMAKAFKLNYSTSTNNNQRISSNPRNRQIAQPGNLNGYNAVQNVKNQVAQNPRVQNDGNQNGLIGILRNGNQTGNGEWVIMLGTARSDQGEGTLLIFRHADLDEIEKVNANCILMANLQQASTSGTQIDKALVYDSDGSAEYTEVLEPIPKPHLVPQNNNAIIYEVTSAEQSGETVEQHPVNFEETCTLYDSLYQNLAIKVEKVNLVNHKLKETNADLTTEL
nr:DNA polymerase epsilon catalytic subunit A-like [Tanacetum cinerariifolium]